MMSWNLEHTDTFGGEANYCWVRRDIVEGEPSHLALVRRAKAFAGFTGMRSEVSDFGDMISIRPRGVCQVVFATWRDGE